MSLWDLRQSGQIHGLQRDTAQAGSKAERAENKIDDFRRTTERQIEHLTLMCQAMWELLGEQAGVTEAQLRAKVADIDTRDGRADGKISPSVFPCPSCGANCNSARQICTMCGEDLKKHKPHLFET